MRFPTLVLGGCMLAMSFAVSTEDATAADIRGVEVIFEPGGGVPVEDDKRYARPWYWCHKNIHKSYYGRPNRRCDGGDLEEYTYIDIYIPAEGQTANMLPFK